MESANDTLAHIDSRGGVDLLACLIGNIFLRSDESDRFDSDKFIFLICSEYRAWRHRV